MYYILYFSAWALSTITVVVVYTLIARRLGLMSFPLTVYGIGALAAFLPGSGLMGITVELFGLRWLDLARCLLAVQAVGFFWSLIRVRIVENAYNRSIAIFGVVGIGCTLMWIFLGQHTP